MKIAIMQPYFFPYIGYFQLINSVDTFVLYDDVNYINKGWVNRNKLLINNKDFIFTLPLSNASQNNLIYSLKITDDFGCWKKKFINTLERNYKKKINFKEAFELITLIFRYSHNNLLFFIDFSLMILCEYLNINTNIVLSSDIEKPAGIKAEDKILYICNKLNAKTYINAIGGKDLYSKEKFIERGVDLKFIKNTSLSPTNSIIETIFCNKKETIINYLTEYELL